MNHPSLGDLKGLKFCIVGSGYFGAVVAERIANDLGENVLVLEKRSHIGGNSFSEIDPETGIEVHKYGSHIFHTNNKKVWDYINRFSGFNSYRHRVWTTYKGRVYSMPINLATINSYYGLSLNPLEAKEFLRKEIERDAIPNPANLEQKAISLIGRPLYEAFIKGYSEKQWETELTKLPPSIITRLPVRFDYNDRYFDDPYEGMPLDGYFKIFERMLGHEKIKVITGIDFFEVRPQLPKNCVIIYTGPIDRYFDYKHGYLGWRTIDFDRETVPVADFQGTSVMNYAEREVRFTRIHEFRHYHPERKHSDKGSVIFREFSRFAKKGEEPYYPINTDSDKEMFERYREEMKSHPNVIFGGRLATYKYLDMHQVIGAALLTYERDIRPSVTGEKWQG